jgi:hypothetical protein
MKTHQRTRSWLLAPLVLAPLSMCGADNDLMSRVRLEEPKAEQLNRFSVGYSAGFNFDARFSRLGNPGKGSGGPGPATGSGVDRQYDDGYNKRSAFDPNNDFGLTWNWGYKNESQLDAANDRLLMHSTRARSASLEDNEDPQHGFQLTYNREFCRSKDNKWIWGGELGFGWNDVKFEANGPVAAGSRTITDTYNLNGVRPPWAGGADSSEYPGHAGDFNGPGTLIEDSPSSRDIVNNPRGTRLTGQREFDADFYFFRVGPYVEFPIVEKLRGVVSGGFACGVMAGHLQLKETTTITGGTTTTTKAEADQAEWLFGGYVAATLLYPVNDEWSVFAGGQFQTLSDYSIEAGGRKMSIDLTTTPFFTAGVSYSF